MAQAASSASSPPARSATAAGATAGAATATTTGRLREVFGFVNAGNLGSASVGYQSWNFSSLSTVAYFGLHVNSGDGTLVTTDTGWSVWNSATLTGLLNAARPRGVRVVVSIILQDFSAGTPQMCAGLQHASTTVSQVASEVRAKGVDGVNVDYEGLGLVSCGTSDGNFTQHAFTSFVSQLRSALAGYYISVDSYGSSAGSASGFFNVPALAAYADSFFVMAYDLDSSNYGSAPLSCPTYCVSPVAPLTTYSWNDTRIVGDYLGVVPASKVILGVPYYGRNVCTSATSPPPPNAISTGSKTSPSYLDAVSTSTTAGVSNYATATDVHDVAGQEPYATWQSSTYSCWREGYWDDVTSLGHKYDLVNQYGLRGAGIFALDYGGGASELWSLLAQKFLAATSLAGILAAGPTASSWGAQRLDAFVEGVDGQLWHRYWDGSAWYGWELLGGQLTDRPSAVSWGANRIDVFVRGIDRQLWHKWWDGSRWNGWEPLGGQLSSAPEVASWSTNRLDVFGVGVDGRLWHKWWDGARWNGWEPLSGQLTSAPGAVSWGPNRIDVFARGIDNRVWHKWWDGNRWNGWEPQGGVFISGPDASSWGPNRLDVFGVGSDHGLWHKSWNGSTWSDWLPLSGYWTGDPGAVSRASGTVDVFNRGADSGLWYVDLAVS